MRDVVITWGPNREFVRLLSASGARFLVIGGTAVRFHAPERREPGDLDLLVEPSSETLAKLNDAIAGVGAPLILSTPAEFARPDKGSRDRGVLNLDVLTPPVGLDFMESWARAEEAMMVLSITRVRVAAISTLQEWLRLAQLREPARAKDFAADLALLERAELQTRRP